VPSRRARRRATTTRSSSHRSTAATSRSRSSPRTTSRWASSRAPTRRRTSARAGSTERGSAITSEDFFVEGVYAQTKVSDELFRQILPGGIFATDKEKLSYYNFSAGYNLFPGEIFIGGRRARPSQFYIVAGVGSTSFADQRKPTFNFGFGYRVYLADWIALQLDLRDHVFSLDLLGKRQNTQNVEFTGGLTVYF
jgi:outer membrane beta-barrel protein